MQQQARLLKGMAVQSRTGLNRMTQKQESHIYLHHESTANLTVHKNGIKTYIYQTYINTKTKRCALLHTRLNAQHINISKREYAKMLSN